MGDQHDRAARFVEIVGRCITSAPDTLSRLPVGSSASTMRGSVMRARDRGDPATTALRGRPEREIVAHAAKIGAAMLAVGARPHESPTTVGPHSLGHVARYVVDHAPCPVLLIRIGGAPGEARRSPGQLK